MDAKSNEMTPAQRMTAGLCPETGVPLEGRDILSHRDQIWDPIMVKHGLSDEGKARFAMLTNYATAKQAK